MSRRTKPLKIFVIEAKDEDYACIEQSLRLCFAEGTLVRAASGQETLTCLEEWLLEEGELPKLILLDLNLPRSEDGLALLKDIKAMPAPSSRIPLILLSANKTAIVEAYQLGASSYCLKPTDSLGWTTLLKALCVYWFEVATLPPRAVRL
jgi:CheY-like chemotaxis protein